MFAKTLFDQVCAVVNVQIQKWGTL